MTRALLFDIDGTLVDTLGAGKAALARALVEVFGESGPVETFDFHGRTDPAIVRGLMRESGREDRDVDAALPRLWSVYVEALGAELASRRGRVRSFPGVLALLDRLRDDDRYAIGLVTGNVEPGAWAKLRAAALDDRFLFGAFGSDSERREDLPPLAVARAAERLRRTFRVEDAMVIGDTPEDVRCARANGARVVAVATGRHSPDELRATGPDAVVADLRDTELVLRILEDG